ncbi:MAG: hypothetical protein EOO28_16540 [Comamonadaceae bacterium]|nr:MAG: hypothetical protein EOO28_16540 [Comamonadaceae bacterium]
MKTSFRTLIAAVPLVFGLTACEGSQNLAARNCLPLQVPAQVTLVQEAGLYQVRDAKTLILMAHPRNTVNDNFHGTRLVRSLPVGSRINVDRLEQATGFDVGKGRISAFGTVASGEKYEFGWGGGTVIGRAPWEPASVPNLRTVSCGK